MFMTLGAIDLAILLANSPVNLFSPSAWSGDGDWIMGDGWLLPVFIYKVCLFSELITSFGDSSIFSTN
jgi:hypothetical protein